MHAHAVHGVGWRLYLPLAPDLQISRQEKQWAFALSVHVADLKNVKELRCGIEK